LAQGVPMVAIPIAFDQPGISARIAHLGVGEFVDNPKGAYEPQNALIISRKYFGFLFC
jgi:UDP:flavonoid glycosyltransferase YjiC (YdhE family)